MTTALPETPTERAEVPADQRWFWTEEWQAGEREAARDIAAGRTTFHASTEEFLAHLDDLDVSVDSDATAPSGEVAVSSTYVRVDALAIPASPDRYEWLVSSAIDAHTEGHPAIGHVFFAMAADMAYRLRAMGVAGWGVRLDEQHIEGVTA